MNLKSLHLTNAWHSSSGGVATFYKELLAAAEREGRLIRLVVPGEATRVEEVGSHGRIYHVKAPRAPFNSAYRVLYPHRFLLPGSAVHRILQDEQPDLIEVCDKYTLPYLAGLLRVGSLPGLRLRPIVIGLSCERMDANVAVYAAGGKFSNLLCDWYMKWIYFPQFDHHIAVSDQTAAELKRAARGHKVERCVWVAPMGVDCDRFSPAYRSAEARCALAARAGLPPEAVLLLYAGRLAPEKNLDLLLSMMERLAAQNSREYRLLIVGSGCSEADLRAQAERRTPGQVRFLGHIHDRDELAHVYANSDVFVHPNPQEPFGIAPLEAMAAGLPLVAPNCGGVTTYANETNAWLADPSPAAFAAMVERVARRDDERIRRCASARTTAVEYRWERAAGDYLRLYREIHDLGRGLATPQLRPPRFRSTHGNLFGLETRRRFVATLLGIAACAASPAISATVRTPAGVCRRYRADATITLLGLPIYSRPSVGGAYAIVQERPAAGVNEVAIQFAAGSLPERAHGLNRFGFIQEIVTERGAVAERAEYLGLMTSSPEKNFGQARRALENKGDRTPFSAIQGRAGGGKFRNRLLRTMFSARLRWNDCPELTPSLRALFAEGDPPGAVVSERPADHARTFLYALRSAMFDPRPVCELPFLYNGTNYSLRARKRPDAGMASKFSQRNLITASDKVVRLDGVMISLEDRSKTEFRLWFERGADAGLPIRFEFRARSFLHLTFEYDASLRQPATIPLLEQESD